VPGAFLHGADQPGPWKRARPGQCWPPCCITLHRPLAGARRGARPNAVGAWLGDQPPATAARIRTRRSIGCCSPPISVLGRPAAARLIRPWEPRGDPGLPGSEAGSGSWERLGPESRRLAGGWLGRSVAAARRSGGAGLGWRPWFADRSELSAADWSVGGLQQGRPQAPAESNDDLNPFGARAGGAGQSQQGLLNVGQETLASSPPYDGVETTAQDAGSGAPPGCGPAAGAGLETGNPSFTTPTP